MWRSLIGGTAWIGSLWRSGAPWLQALWYSQRAVAAGDYLLTESGSRLTTESGDKLTQE